MEKKKQESNFFRSFTLKRSKKKINMKYLFVLLSIGILFMVIGSLMNNPNESTSLPTASLDNEDQNEEKEEEEEETSEVFKRNDKPKEISTMTEYETLYERQLEEALEKVVGISDVSVVVNLAESEKTVYQSNSNSKDQTTEETDREGGTRGVQDKTTDEQVVIVRNGEKEEALIRKIEKPDIRGVLVVAKGVENIEVKTWVVEAVSRVLDVPSHRVSVLPKKSKEE